MSIGRAQLEAIIEALTVILPARAPADAQLRTFFREHKNLGHRDRALVADTAYAALRRRRMLEHVTPTASPREIALATLVKLQGVGLAQIESALKPGEKAWLTELKARDLGDLPFELRVDLPDWVIERLRPALGDAELLALARGLQDAAPLDLRVNTLKAPREAVLDRLEYDEIEARAHALLAPRRAPARQARAEPAPHVPRRRGGGAGRRQPTAGHAGRAAPRRDGGRLLRRRGRQDAADGRGDEFHRPPLRLRRLRQAARQPRPAPQALGPLQRLPAAHRAARTTRR